MAAAEQPRFIGETYPQTFDWSSHFAARSRQMRRSTIREMLKLTQASDFISFGGGMPAPEMFPIRAFRDACVTVLEAQGKQALQYGPTEGYPALREHIAEGMRRFGLEISADNVLLTSGSQQALDLIGKVFVEAGRSVCIERPTYVGALQAWSSYHADYELLQLDQDGAIPDDLIGILRARQPRFVYLLPNFHNPAGVSMSVERRAGS